MRPGRFKNFKSDYIMKKIMKKLKKIYKSEEKAWDKISDDYLLMDKTLEHFKDKLNWDKVTKNILDYRIVSAEFLEQFKDKLNWKILSKTGYSEDIICKFADKFDLDILIEYNDVPTYIIKKYFDKMKNYECLFSNFYFSEKFLESHIDLYDYKIWGYISINQKLSENFIEKYKDNVNWSHISYYQKLSEKFMDKYVNKLDWKEISIGQTLSENFIEKYINKIDWNFISKFQRLSESFIDKYQKNLDWEEISEYQIMSEEFIKKHIDKINKSILYNNECDFSDEFISYLKILFSLRGDNND